jgi:hypothetical protein
MKTLDTKQKRFLQWVVETQDNLMNTTIAEIILEQGVYGDKLQILLNELVDIYKQEYLKFMNV